MAEDDSASSEGRSSNLIPMLLFGAILLIGILALVIGAMDLSDNLEVQDWPTTEGMVVQVDILTSTSRGQTTYSPCILYGYNVDGQYYTSDSIGTIRHYTDDFSYAEDYLAKYPLGSQVEVHYYPDDPSYAVLETGLGPWVLFPLAVGGLMVAISTILFVKTLRHR